MRLTTTQALATRLVACLAVSCACSVALAHAQEVQAVIWLDHAAALLGHEIGHDAARLERARALGVELHARRLELIDGFAPEALTIDAAAVLWIERDPKRAVTWLCARGRGTPAIVKTPLPSPPDVVAPELLAVAAGHLLEQVLGVRARIPNIFGIRPLPEATH